MVDRAGPEFPDSLGGHAFVDRRSPPNRDLALRDLPLWLPRDLVKSGQNLRRLVSAGD